MGSSEEGPKRKPPQPERSAMAIQPMQKNAGRTENRHAVFTANPSPKPTRTEVRFTTYARRYSTELTHLSQCERMLKIVGGEGDAVLMAAGRRFMDVGEAGEKNADRRRKCWAEGLWGGA